MTMVYRLAISVTNVMHSDKRNTEEKEDKKHSLLSIVGHPLY